MKAAYEVISIGNVCYALHIAGGADKRNLK